MPDEKNRPAGKLPVGDLFAAQKLASGSYCFLIYSADTSVRQRREMFAHDLDLCAVRPFAVVQHNT